MKRLIYRKLKMLIYRKLRAILYRIEKDANICGGADIKKSKSITT